MTLEANTISGALLREPAYTAERNAQILIALMKAHGIRKVIVSPGATNMCFAGSLQSDPYFELYSSVDERSAAYIACGLAAESGEAVALSCTGATASRNYMPGLTEAYYRKLPILAVTSSQHSGRIGQGLAQVTDRRNPPRDVQKLSVDIPVCHTSEDEWACNVHLNAALLELFRHGGGPVHINLQTDYSTDFNTRTLPETRAIRRISQDDPFPKLEAGKIGIFVGSHRPFDSELTEAVDAFCEAYDAVVFCDHCSGYSGQYRAFASLVTAQCGCDPSIRRLDTLIHIGEVAIGKMWLKPSCVWRVNPDGEVVDPFRKLSYVFEMSEVEFFQRCADAGRGNVIARAGQRQIDRWTALCTDTAGAIPELPFSNLWSAQNTAQRLPEDSVLHLGILNSARSWNFFEVSKGVDTFINTGGYGIDGCVSALLGASLASPDRLHFGIVGDLAFFYDMNALGNRHVGSNLRLMIINNGCGAEFQLYNHPYTKGGFTDLVGPYLAAAGHFGKCSRQLVRHYAEDLGFVYLSAENKKEYLVQLVRFLESGLTEKPILFEVFTDPAEESAALKTLRNLPVSW